MRRAVVFTVATLALAFSACKATPPGKRETGFMAGAKRRLFVHNKSAVNPMPSSKENVEAGRVAFSHYCAACHGLDGQNTGVPFAEKMSPPVPPLTSKTVQAYTDGQLKWVIDNGLWPSGMPGSKGVLTDEEIWSIVVYIRHLPPAGSLGEPAMYSGEDCSTKPAGEPQPAK
jgi:mono/diheme cytochrome c family protein